MLVVVGVGVGGGDLLVGLVWGVVVRVRVRCGEGVVLMCRCCCCCRRRWWRRGVVLLVFGVVFVIVIVAVSAIECPEVCRRRMDGLRRREWRVGGRCRP